MVRLSVEVPLGYARQTSHWKHHIFNNFIYNIIMSVVIINVYMTIIPLLLDRGCMKGNGMPTSDNHKRKKEEQNYYCLSTAG